MFEKMFEKVEWADCSAILREVKSELHAVLEEVARCLRQQNIEPFLYKKRYQFGDPIVTDGRIDLEDTELPPELGYASVPLGIVTGNSVEIYERETSSEKETLYPLRVLNSGDFVGLFETLDHLNDLHSVLNGSWSLAAGARSVAFMHNTDSVEFATQLTKGLGKRPNFINRDELQTPWHVCKFLTRFLQIDWNVEIYYFPNIWFKESNSGQSELQHWQSRFIALLLESGWTNTAMLRSAADKGQFYRIWEKTNSPLQGKIGTVYRNIGFDLYMMSIGGLPCMVRSEHNESLGPFERIKAVLGEHLNNFNPIILIPGYLGENNNQEGFLSARMSPYRTSAKSFTWGDNNLLFFDTLCRLNKMIKFRDLNIEDLLVINAPNYSARFWSATIAQKYKEFELGQITEEYFEQSIGNYFEMLKLSLPLKTAPDEVWDEQLRVINSCLTSTFFQSCILLQRAKFTEEIPLKKMPLIDWVLSRLIKDVNVEKCSDVALVAHQHLLPSTFTMLRALTEVAFAEENVFVIGKPYSTIATAQSPVAENKIHIFSAAEADSSIGYDASMRPHFEAFWQTVLQHVRQHGIKKIILLDEGGCLRLHMPPEIEKQIEIIGVEQTTSGVLKDREERIATVMVALSAAKRQFESPFIAQSICEYLLHQGTLTRVSQVGIIGLGYLGSCLARVLMGYGLTVRFWDPNVNKAVSARGAVATDNVGDLIRSCNLILGCSGTDSIDVERDLQGAQGDKTFVSCSSRDIEFRSLLNLRKNVDRKNCFGDVDIQLDIQSDKSLNISLLNGGYPINFDRCKEWEAPENIQLTRALLIAGILQALLTNQNLAAGKQVKLDPQIQQSIVSEWLRVCHKILPNSALHNDSLVWWQQESGGESSELLSKVV